jgi:hypothetical protein
MTNSLFLNFCRRLILSQSLFVLEEGDRIIRSSLEWRWLVAFELSNLHRDATAEKSNL